MTLLKSTFHAKITPFYDVTQKSIKIYDKKLRMITLLINGNCIETMLTLNHKLAEGESDPKMQKFFGC